MYLLEYSITVLFNIICVTITQRVKFSVGKNVPTDKSVSVFRMNLIPLRYLGFRSERS